MVVPVSLGFPRLSGELCALSILSPFHSLHRFVRLGVLDLFLDESVDRPLLVPAPDGLLQLDAALLKK